MPLLHRAAWVLPIAAPPIHEGWVLVDRGRIVDVGGGRGPEASYQEHSQPRTANSQIPSSNYRAQTAILPGLVNSHTHLELSWMRGRVPSSERFDDWIRALVSLRRRNPDAVSAGITDAAVAALDEARRCGTIAFGDISNTFLTPSLFVRAGCVAHVFFELIGFNEPDPEGRVRSARETVDAIERLGSDVRGSLAPHAPYTVSPALFRAIQRDLDAHPGARCSVHLGESSAEVEFLRDGSGPIAEALQGLGAWDPGWRPPECSPVEYLAHLRVLDERTIVVHGVQLTDSDLRRLRDAEAVLVTCPRSNRWTGAGIAPVERFYASGVRVAIGTDSLASGDDLNMFNEMAAVRALAPNVPASRILHSATLGGAEALGFGSEVGSIEPGKRAGLIAVRLPDDVADVEEYLVGGCVEPSGIRWLHAW